MLSSGSDKTELFAKNFSRSSNLDDSSISLPIILSRTTLMKHNISITPKLAKKVITNLNLPEASDADFTPVVLQRT